MRFAWLVLLFGCGSGPETECADGTDNDNDGQLDCDDPDCAAECLEETGSMPSGVPTGSITTGTPTGQLQGDLGCWNPGDPWTTRLPTSGGTAVSLGIETIDWMEQVPVPQVTVEAWFDGVVDASPDGEWLVDNSGLQSADLPTCAPIALRTTTDPNLFATKTTYLHGRVLPPTGPVELEVVSETTYRLIPTILGEVAETDKAMILGRITDCAGEPIAGAQARATVNGATPPTLRAHYFTERFPDRDQPSTSADGLYLLTNVPPGEVALELWGPEDAPVQIAAGTVTVYADAFSLVETPYGTEDMVNPPAGCP